MWALENVAFAVVVGLAAGVSTYLLQWAALIVLSLAGRRVTP